MEIFEPTLEGQPDTESDHITPDAVDPRTDELKELSPHSQALMGHLFTYESDKSRKF